jgi:hypothetical protein
MSDYYSSTPRVSFENLVAFRMNVCRCNDLSHRQLSKLVAAFNERYQSSYTLLIQCYTDQSKHDQKDMLVVKSLSCFTGINDDFSTKMTSKEEREMIGFIQGFIAGLRSVRIKKL